jgi:SAM-dependent methyltransferase
MDEATIAYYDKNAVSISDKYENVNMSFMQKKLVSYLPENGNILEIGSGSGRDAAFFVSEGFNVTVVDPSKGMLRKAAELHPELCAKMHCCSLPFEKDNPLLKEKFKAVLLIASIMHIQDEELFESAYQIREMLEPEGILVISSSMGRKGMEDSRDLLGRLHIERPVGQIQLLFERLGFRLITILRNEDILQREIQWFTIIMEKIRGQISRSVDEIETIISRDRKDATYKLALLRALCHIAQRESNRVNWLRDGDVSVPLGLVVERWLIYYWPILEMDCKSGKVVIPQKRGLEINKPIAFRKSLVELVRFYNFHGGISGFYHDFRSGTVPQEGLLLVDTAANEIARTIVSGPVTYTGGALIGQESYFNFEGKRTAKGKCYNLRETVNNLGSVTVPGKAWKEFCLIGHWIEESLILRWAELTHEITRKTVPIKDIVEKLLIQPTTERDVNFVRSVYRKIDDMRCVWTGVPLGTQFVVDHAIPFSLWKNNDLWNLLPVAKSVNAEKRDKLVGRRTLETSKDRIVYYWEVLRENAAERFSMEVDHSLVRGKTDLVDWKTNAFLGLMENVEMLAIQRGTERWDRL